MHERRAGRRIAERIVATCLAMLTHDLAAQNPIPETFTNLEVLPEAISRSELVEVMKGFTFALGVRCEHCHATKPEADPASGRLEDLDFASDAREAKRTARAMLRMVRSINEDHLAPLPGEAKLAVNCATCHRGVTRPEPIEAVVVRAFGEQGAEGAATEYRDLRESYYGGAAYDFSEWPLNRLGQSLLETGSVPAAVAVLRLNAEFHPGSGWLAYLLGEAELASGDRAAARAAFARAVELEPRNPRARQRLDELTSSPPEPQQPRE